MKTTLEGDICVVGAGPAGLTLAHALSTAGRDVVLLESGGRIPDPRDDALNEGTTSGDPYPDLRLSRHRQVGGTARIWNTFLDDTQGAKQTPLDPIDFEARTWVPHSGWPFDRVALEPYYRRAHEVCGLGTWVDGKAAWFPTPHRLLPLPGPGLRNDAYLFGPAAAFTEKLPAALRSVRLFHGLTVTRLALDRDGCRVTEAHWASRTGERGTLRARVWVLATGGIENPRLLLASGMRHEWLGRGFMEHPRDRSLRLVLPTPVPLADFGFYLMHRAPSGQGLWGRLALNEDVRCAERLLGASVTLWPEPNPAGSRELWRRVARRPASRNRPIRSLGLLVHLEQAPHPDNRISLTDRQDPQGMPQVRLHWRWRAEDEASRRRVLRIVAGELHGVGRVEQADEGLPDPHAHHHAGTTRMHPDPRESVADADGRIRGLENLYVTGNSVFPTAGFANPTLTIVALALRLGDHLAAR